MTAILTAPVLERSATPEIQPEIGFWKEWEGDEPKKMATGLHGTISSTINAELLLFVRSHKLGRVFDSSTTYNFKDGLAKRMPDVSFISQGRVPEKLDDEITVAPDLAIEVVSKNDLVIELDAKVKQYQRAGVSLIWIVYPSSETVEVYQLGSKPKAVRLDAEDELDGGEMLPGFKLTVKAIFE